MNYIDNLIIEFDTNSDITLYNVYNNLTTINFNDFFQNQLNLTINVTIFSYNQTLTSSKMSYKFGKNNLNELSVDRKASFVGYTRIGAVKFYACEITWYCLIMETYLFNELDQLVDIDNFTTFDNYTNKQLIGEINYKTQKISYVKVYSNQQEKLVGIKICTVSIVNDELNYINIGDTTESYSNKQQNIEDGFIISGVSATYNELPYFNTIKLFTQYQAPFSAIA